MDGGGLGGSDQDNEDVDSLTEEGDDFRCGVGG